MNEYEIAGIIGGCLAAAWILAYLFSWIGCWAWAWVDDSKAPKSNPIIAWFMYKLGWKDRESDCFRFKRQSKQRKHWEDISDGSCVIVGGLIISAAFPMGSLIAFKFYPIAIGIVIAYGVAHLARYSRRHKKVFDEHVEDKKAHT